MPLVNPSALFYSRLGSRRLSKAVDTGHIEIRRPLCQLCPVSLQHTQDIVRNPPGKLQAGHTTYTGKDVSMYSTARTKVMCTRLWVRQPGPSQPTLVRNQCQPFSLLQ